MTASLTPEEAEAMLLCLGTKLVSALLVAANLGHSRVQETVRDYVHNGDYPPVDDNAAAMHAVVEILRNDSRPEEIIRRHPWLRMLTTSPGETVATALGAAA